MARIIQVLLPLVCVVLAEAQRHLPYFDISLPHPPQPLPDGPRDNRPPRRNRNYHNGFATWHPPASYNPDEHPFIHNRHERDKTYEDFGPVYYGEPYYNYDGWDYARGINHVFNIPNLSHSTHTYVPSHTGNNQEEKQKTVYNDDSNAHIAEKYPKTISAIDDEPTEEENSSELNNANILDVKNNSDISPPKTNEIKNKDEKGSEDDKQVGIDKKKDFLLVGQGSNGNDVYLLHENNPNPNSIIAPNIHQPGNNVMYIPYNPGPPKNPVYHVINTQLAPSATNIQLTSDKLGVSNGYNNAAVNPGQPTMNMNADAQDPGYVTIYSNGQLIHIPGVVVNSAPNNVPSLNGNQVQGANYIIANTVPNNAQTVPVIQNPGTNVIYATLPNQAPKGQIYMQYPVQAVNNDMSNNGLPSNMVIYQPNSNIAPQPTVYSNSAPNDYVQSNMATNSDQRTMASPNGQYQPEMLLTVNSGSNGYNQPIVSNLGQEQNTLNQKGVINNQNIPKQSAAQMPVDSSNNGYNQPSVTNDKLGHNVPNQEGIVNNQNIPLQTAVETPVNNGIPQYNQPMESNEGQGLKAPNQGAIVNNQNMQPAIVIPLTNGYNEHPMVINPSPSVNIQSQVKTPCNQNELSQPALSAGSGSNGYIQPPQVSNQRDQSTNTLVNSPSNAAVITQPGDSQPLATSLVLDSDNLSSLGAQPAIMISRFKDTGDKKDKKDKKDKNDEKDEENKKDEEKKKDEKAIDLGDITGLEPFTNKKI